MQVFPNEDVGKQEGKNESIKFVEFVGVAATFKLRVFPTRTLGNRKGSNLASGVYFYRLDIKGETQEFSKIMRMVLIK